MERRSRLIVIATSAAALMIGLDFTGAAAVVTQIEADFSSDLTTTQWILTIYALTFGMGIVAGGKLGDTLGHRTVLLAGLALFGLGSLAVLLAPEISVAIIFRGVQGIGGALVWPSIVAITFNAAPAGKRGLAVGLVLGAAGLGNVLGPLLAGAFAELLTWRLLFAINLPIVAVVAVMAVTLIPAGARTGGRGLDLPGLTALSLGLFGLMFALDVGASWGWDSVGVILIFAGSLAAFVAFAVLEPRSDDPLIPRELLSDRGFLAALLANGLLVPTWFASFVYLPQFLQKSLDASAFEGAVGLLPAMVVFAVLSPVAGRLYPVLGPRLMLVVGYALVTAAAVNFAVAEPDWGYAGILPGLLLLGTGAGLTISTAGTAAVAAVDEEHSGSAGGLSFMFHLVFGAVGVAVGTALFTGAADTGAQGEDFATGMHAVFTFTAVAAAVGLLTSLLVRTRDVRAAAGDAS